MQMHICIFECSHLKGSSIRDLLYHILLFISKSPTVSQVALVANAGDIRWVRSLSREDALGMAVHSIILAWRIPMDRGACRWAIVHGIAESDRAVPTTHWWLSGKESACQCRRHRFDPWVRKIPWRRKRQSTPVFLPGKSCGQRSLMGYSPWSCKRVLTY